MLESIIKTDLTVGVFLICTAVSVALGIAVALVGMYRSGMHAELCDRACGASRGRADRYNARERKYRGGRRRRGRVQPCTLPLRAGKREGDRVDIPRHGDRTCRRNGICGSCGDTVRYGCRRDTYTYRSQFRRRATPSSAYCG